MKISKKMLKRGRICLEEVLARIQGAAKMNEMNMKKCKFKTIFSGRAQNTRTKT